MGVYVFKLPDVGEGTAEAEVVSWHVKPGDKVSEDQPLVDVMTDKATVEITSPVSGVVSAIHGEPGEMAAVGSALVVLEVEGAGNADAAPAPAPAAAKAEKAKPQATAEKPAPAQAAAPVGRQGGYVFRLPDVGEGTAEAEIVAWHVKPGDTVAEDQQLVDVMTDKATVEITSPVAGVVASIHGEPGQMAAVGGALVTFDVEGAPAAAPAGAEAKVAAPAPKPAAPKAAPASPARSNVTVSRPSVARVPGERPLASPAVRRRARELGVELQFVAGSGPAGRIEHADLDAFIAGGGRTPSPVGGGSVYARRDGTEEIRVIGLRRKIAEKMAESKRRIPHFMYAEEVDVTELEALRAHLNATRDKDRPKLTLLPFIIRALCRTLPEHPSINSRFDDEAGVVTRYEAVHCGIATQTPNGLMVPVVRHAEALDVWGCAAEIVRVSGAARDGSATKDELTGSTITVTSLGPMGGLVHAPVVNYPEVAIVGPNKIIDRPVVRHGQVVVRRMMNISSSFDHRIVDGWDAAEFIQKIKAALEHPATLFMD